MRKYFLYLNGKQFMEMPKQYGIKQDIYMSYNDLIDRYFKDRNLMGKAIPHNRRISILSELINDPKHINSIIRHELTHIKQMRETPSFTLQYKRAMDKYGYKGSPYEVEARQWANKNIPLHRVGTFDIKYQKQLEKWQSESPKEFKSLAEKEKARTIFKPSITKKAVDLIRKRLSKFSG
ncbi:unnamed protein product [marine sediment metagenome]|uniref:SprT-like domain-containing protein n=1 Tax=marine sediment metagenome TaxID=412755 RepID=X0ZN14_9ZZZZ